MTIAGVIAEYNPFHNGHLYHLEATRRATGCDGVVVCLAGNFTQRGEAAMFSKWTRARIALLCGADAVFELPALFAVRTADFFARGGVGVLAGLGCDALSFGCETDDMALLKTLAELREDEPEALSRKIRRRLETGMSISIQPGLYHDFEVEPGTGAVLIGEVSQCNDDNTDNRFNPPVGRFPAIEEDEPPYRLLCNEYLEARE